MESFLNKAQNDEELKHVTVNMINDVGICLGHIESQHYSIGNKRDQLSDLKRRICRFLGFNV